MPVSLVDLTQTAKAFVHSVLARELLGVVAAALESCCIEIMPLKGVLLHALVYAADPTQRPLTDVDIAVRSRDFDTAYRTLSDVGFLPVRGDTGGYDVELRSGSFPLSLDLHRDLASARRFRLTPDAMFARGWRDDALFGFRVVLPDVYDLYAHLLAHSVLDFMAGPGWHMPDDVALLDAKFDLEPEECARRLEEHGLGRLARVALAPSTPFGAQPLSPRVLAALKEDPMGTLIARVVHLAPRAEGRPALLRRTLAVLLNPTLFEGGVALIEAARRRAWFLSDRRL